MNTNSLKKFATQARSLLMHGVRNRLRAIGFDEDGTVRETPHAVDGGVMLGSALVADPHFMPRWEALRHRIEAHGVKNVVEEAAYTWFNRLMALRILTRNGLAPAVLDYVNPDIRLPRIVTDARAGKTPILSADDRAALDRVILDGRLAFEQFAILIRAVCENNAIIRNCFGGITDYTALLLPADILAEGNFIDLLNDADSFISADEWRKPELIGWLYQFYISEKKDEVFAKKGGYDSDEIPAATQIFTPNWIVKYMVENTLGRLWADREIKNKNEEIKNNSDAVRAAYQEIKERMGWNYMIVPEGESLNSDFLFLNSINTPLEELKCADLSCGSGHILNEMFDLLMQLYTDDFYSPREAIEAIFTKNMVGIDLDIRARQLAQFALLLKACQTDSAFANGHCMPRIYSFPDVDEYTWRDLNGHFNTAYNIVETDASIYQQIDAAFKLMRDADALGSIMKFDLSASALDYIRKAVAAFDAEPKFAENFTPLVDTFRIILALTDKYAAICMNPPYMPTNKEPRLKTYANREYPDSKSDLFAIFMDVATDRLEDHGKYGMINMQSWMFLSSFDGLRKEIIDNQQIDSLLHLGPRTFDELSGEVVQNAAFVISNEKPTYPGIYYRLIDGKNCTEKKEMFLAGLNRYEVADQKQFEQIPGAPIAYWVSEKIRETFSNEPPVVASCKPLNGATTGDNGRFVRSWFEVAVTSIGFGCASASASAASGRKFFPYNKGGSVRKWYGNQELVVNWENDGKEIKSFSGAVIRNPSFYFKPSIAWSLTSSNGYGFRVFPAGFIFDVNGMSLFGGDKSLLCFLNSKLCHYFLGIINPTLSCQCGNVAVLPRLKTNDAKFDEEIAKDCIAISKEDWDAHETSWDFATNPLLAVDTETYLANIDWTIEKHRRKTGETLCIDPAAPELDSLRWRYNQYCDKWESLFDRLHHNEEELNRKFIEIYGLQDELSPNVPLKDITILQQGEVSLGGQASLPVQIAETDTRRHLPHRAGHGTLQHITFRLADSLPQSVLSEYKAKKDSWLANHQQPWDASTQKEYHSLFSHRMDEFLDNGYGACVLRQPAIADIIENAIRFHDGKKYNVLAYVIMPNHVHLLVEVGPEYSISSICHSIKSFTSNEINKIIGKSGRLWMEESFDREIRNEEHYNNVIRYIWKNFRSVGVRIYDATIEEESCYRDRQGCLSSQLRFNADVVIKQFISYAIGCMMGRYRLDRPGLAIAHPGPYTEQELAPYELKNEELKNGDNGDKNFLIFNSDFLISEPEARTWWIDDDGIVPMMGADSPFHDNAANRFSEFVRVALGNEKHTDNMNFIRECLGKDVVNYLRNDFYADHKRMYQNRPIYWMFSSNQKGKRAAFQCLVYMHRMDRFTPEHIRTNYLLPYIDHLAAREAELMAKPSLTTKESKELKQLRSDLEECRDYQLRLHAFADQQIAIDLDDGVVKNYATFASVLAKLK